MSSIPPHLSDKDEISREDLLRAMEKLSQIIDIDKKLEGIHSDNLDYYESPVKRNSARNQPFHSPNDQNQSRDIDYLKEPELIENVKAAARDFSELVHKTGEVDRSYRKSIRSQQNSGYDANGYPYGGSNKLSSTINRLYELDSKKKERIAILQFQKYKEELATLKAKPEISLNSKILAENRVREPIYQRSQTILKQKEDNINKLKKQIEEQKNQKDPPPTFQPNLVSKKPLQENNRIRSAKEFTSQVYAWQSRKQELLQKEQYETLTKEMEELTFKPKINKKSRELAEKKRDKEPVELRLQKLKEDHEEKMREIREKEKPLFRPILNERSINLSRNRKNCIEDLWKNSTRRENDHSFVGMHQITEESHRGSFEGSRSITPGRSSKRTARYEAQGSKTPRIHEIEYTPAMDFLLKKIA